MEPMMAVLHIFSAHGLMGVAAVTVLVLIVFLAKSVYPRHASRIGPIVSRLRNIANLAIERSIGPQLELLRHGPEWSKVAQYVNKSASFISTNADSVGNGTNLKALFDFFSHPEAAYQMRRPRPKIYVFFCQGIRPKITWIDYMYLRLLNELREEGARILILLHNDQFDRDSELHFRPRHTSPSSVGLLEMRENVHKLFGPDLARSIKLGKEYLTGNRKLMQRYIEFIYDDVAALYADDGANGQVPHEIPNANEFANTINGFASSSLLAEKRFVLYLGWERQTSKWTNGPLRKLSGTLCDGFVVGTTITQETGSRVDVYSSTNVLNLFDTDEVMATKLFGVAPGVGNTDLFFTDLTTVKNICIGPARLTQMEWDYSTIKAQMSPKTLEEKLGKYQNTLRPYGSGLTDILKDFVLSPLHGLNKIVLDEVCARCAAYEGMRGLRDGRKQIE